MFRKLHYAAGLCFALILMVACREETPKTHTDNLNDNKVELQYIKAPEPSQNTKLERFTPPRIVPDQELKDYDKSPTQEKLEEAQIGTINQEGVKDEGIVAPPVEKGTGEVEAPPYNTENYDHIIENQFLTAKQNPLSTFSIDVDEAAYSNVRRYINEGQLPPKGAVRIEEMINYFDYEYPQPTGPDPFAVITESAECPWNKQHQLVHIGLQGVKIEYNALPPANLVFLIDVSGSMEGGNRLPLVKESLNMLANQLRPQDKVSIVVYAGSAGLVLPSTSGSNKQAVKNALNNLSAGGSTAGGQGIQLAYDIARKNFIKGGNNRIVLCTDGDFNVGVSSDDELITLIETERKSGVFLSILGYGMGNYKDNKMQQLADKGNGNHSYIDNANEAKKVLVNEFGSTLFTIAKDVKLQIEFNPQQVQAYRLVGYENRLMANEDFNNDTKDAGELGAGHTVTALYEVIPTGVKDNFTKSTNPLKYQIAPAVATTLACAEIMTIKLRYKRPDGEVSKLITHPVTAGGKSLSTASDNFRFSAAVAQFGLLLRNSEFKQQASFADVLTLANGASGNDAFGYRKEFINLVKEAAKLKGDNRVTVKK